MKLQYVSDVHGNYNAVQPDPTADLLIVAGDWSDGEPELSLLQRWPVPVIYVLGNHEYYREDTENLIAQMRRKTKRTNIKFLEESALVYQGVRFIGCTGWTDFANLHPWLLLKAWDHMTDYRRIKAESWLSQPSHREAFLLALRKMQPHAYETGGFHPLIAHSKHVQARLFLEQQLSTPFDGPTVVITHHPPTPRGLRHFGRWLPEPNPDMDFEKLHQAFPKVGWHRVGTYASRLDDLIRAYKPTLWIHGHIHHTSMYFIDKTLILSNAIGHYPKKDNIKTIQIPQIPWWEKQNTLKRLTLMHADWLQHSVLPSFSLSHPHELWAPHVWRLHQDALTEAFELGGTRPPISTVEESLKIDFWREQVDHIDNFLKSPSL